MVWRKIRTWRRPVLEQNRTHLWKTASRRIPSHKRMYCMTSYLALGKEKAWKTCRWWTTSPFWLMRILQLSFLEDIIHLTLKWNWTHSGAKLSCLYHCIRTLPTSCLYTIQNSSFSPQVQPYQPYKRHWTRTQRQTVGIFWNWLRSRSWTRPTTPATMI